jgi:hypothetical protein
MIDGISSRAACERNSVYVTCLMLSSEISTIGRKQAESDDDVRANRSCTKCGERI